MKLIYEGFKQPLLRQVSVKHANVKNCVVDLKGNKYLYKMIQVTWPY